MKKLLFALIMLAFPLMAGAQLRYGYFSQDAVLKSMSDYVLAQRTIDELRQKYDDEMKRSEREFNAKYEDFLEAQRSLVPSILRKRQAELQDMMEKNVAFRQEAQRLLRQSEADVMAPVRMKLSMAVTKVGQERGYAFIINTDADACPYINPGMGEDATTYIMQALESK